jgi:hypothetical protein
MSLTYANTTDVASRVAPSHNWRDLDPEGLLASLGLCLNKPESVIICIRCKYALIPSGEGVSKHLGNKHGVSAAARRGLKTFIVSLDFPDPNKVALRTDGGLPHPDLLILQGVVCNLCPFRSTSRDLMRRHMSKAHNEKSGRNDGLGDGVRDNVSLQSWTQSGPRKYWIVEPPVIAVLPDVDAHLECSPRRRAFLATLHEGEQRRLAQIDKDRSEIDDGPDDITLTGPWMRRTGWATTFAGADRCLLRLLCQNPAVSGRHLELGCYGTRRMYSSADDEQRLAAIGRAVDHFFDRCEDTVRHTDHSIRCWLKSQLPGRSYKAPFEIPGREATIKQYRRWWKRMMYVSFRLYRIDDAARDEFLRVRLSDKQKEAFQLVWATAHALVQNNEGGIDEMEEEDEIEEEIENDEEDEDDNDDEEEEDADDSNYADDGGEEGEDDENGTGSEYVDEIPQSSGIGNGMPFRDMAHILDMLTFTLSTIYDSNQSHGGGACGFHRQAFGVSLCRGVPRQPVHFHHHRLLQCTDWHLL